LLAFATAALLAPVLSIARAQTGEISVSIDGFSPSGWPEAQAIVTVLDANGKPVEGLTQENVHAQINDADISVTSVSRGVDSNLASFVVLGLDASANTTGTLLEQEKAAAHQFVDTLAPKDSIAILAYSDAPNLVQAFTQDRAAAHTAIDSLTAGGGNGLYGAATQAVLLSAASVQTGRRAVVLVSAGADSTQGDPGQSLVAAKGLGVPLFVVGAGTQIDRSYLQQLTDAAGGRLLEAAVSESLPAILGDVGELLRNQYVIDFDASALDIDTTHLVNLTLDVTTSGATGTTQRIVCPGSVCAVFQGIEEGVRVAEAQQIVAEVVSTERIQSVSLLVDGESVKTLQTAPYEFELDPAAYGSGSHTLALAVATASGSLQLGEVSVELGPASGGGGGPSMLLFAALGLVMVAIAGIVFFFLRRRQGGSVPPTRKPTAEPSEPISVFIAKQRARPSLKAEAPMPRTEPIEAEPTLGYLSMTDGPLAGQVFAVGAKPISIGSGHRCEVQLPVELEGYEVPSEYARVWIRGDQLMVHEIRRLTAMGAVGGRWEFLGPNETFAIGPCVFRFVLDEPRAAPSEPVPNILRDKPRKDPPLPKSAVEGDGPPVPPAPILLSSVVESPLPRVDATADDVDAVANAGRQPSSGEAPSILRDRRPDDSLEGEPPVEQAASG
jgi:Mg-chelatase subunit ChlD